MRLWDQSPITSVYFHFNFSLCLLLQPRSGGFESRSSHYFYQSKIPLLLSCLAESLWVQIPHLSFFQLSCSEVLGSIPTDLTCLKFILKLLKLQVFWPETSSPSVGNFIKFSCPYLTTFIRLFCGIITICLTHF